MKNLFLAAVIIPVLAGCSFFSPSTQIVALKVTPPTAIVIANGVAYTGGSPYFLEVARNRELLLTIYQKGYITEHAVVGNSLSSTGTVDAWGSILIIPFFGLFTGGAWNLDENNLEFVLHARPAEEEEKTAAPADANASPTTPAGTVETAGTAPATAAEKEKGAAQSK